MTQSPSYSPYVDPRNQPPPGFNVYAIVALLLTVAVFPPLGIYFGNKAKEQIARTGERGIEMARAAVIIGWVLTAPLIAGLTIGAVIAIAAIANA